MVDIQSAAARKKDIERRKKDRNQRESKNIITCHIPYGGHN